MMNILKDLLYTIDGNEASHDNTIFHIALIKDSWIYRAHFPGNPVTPGVCIVQTALELLEQIINCELEITEVKDIRFLHILSPVACPKVDFVFTTIINTGGDISTMVNVMKNNTTFAQLSFTARNIPNKETK